MIAVILAVVWSLMIDGVILWRYYPFTPERKEQLVQAWMDESVRYAIPRAWWLARRLKLRKGVSSAAVGTAFPFPGWPIFVKWISAGMILALGYASNATASIGVVLVLATEFLRNRILDRSMWPEIKKRYNAGEFPAAVYPERRRAHLKAKAARLSEQERLSRGQD